MNNASHLENAENCTEMALDAKDDPTRRRFERLAESWRALAEAQDWLDGKSPRLEETETPRLEEER